jgi:hypothetical protein
VFTQPSLFNGLTTRYFPLWMNSYGTSVCRALCCLYGVLYENRMLIKCSAIFKRILMSVGFLLIM